ncbi:YdiU family protein [Cardiobacteriaceae bacterium TAE3-ERU3]|nr:YdiU family protein [Cardiobacteriaceae bacterium TAE3-ERU3]
MIQIFHFDNSYRNLPSALYSEQKPTPVNNPQLLMWNDELAQTLNLGNTPDTTTLANLFAGNTLPDDAQPIAQAYAGHQFGNFTILGDGRAILLGEHVNNGNHHDIVLKGAGRTPYSRHGDGRAALAPVLREYLVSEAMHALNIPTSRALAAVSTGEAVYREQAEKGAILTRVARSHLRVGTFEYAAAKGGSELVQTLLDYAIARHYPDCVQADNPTLAFLHCVGNAQAELVSEWMRVGFIHGVMNTDNCAISGDTLDYGPCAFMDNYDPATVFSYIDRHGRYAYANQPHIAQWNIARLAETLLPLINSDSKRAISHAEQAIHDMGDYYQDTWLNMMRRKLGLLNAQKDDEILINDLLALMNNQHADYTNTFADLTRIANSDHEITGDNDALRHWQQCWRTRLNDEPDQQASLAAMRHANPVIIPRNHQVARALEAAENGDLQPFHDLHHALATPYQDSPDKQPYSAPPQPHEQIKNTFCGT